MRLVDKKARAKEEKNYKKSAAIHFLLGNYMYIMRRFSQATLVGQDFFLNLFRKEVKCFDYLFRETLSLKEVAL